MKKPANAAAVRLQKFLAEAGLASRRKAEEIIMSGRVRVNGKVVTELGTRVDPARDLVVVDGAPVERLSKRRYVLLYKPPGCVTTLSDPQGRPTARGYLQGVKERVFPVGRLDYDSEGLLLLTNDGDLAQRLTHPSYGVEKTYLAEVEGVPTPATLRRLRDGVELDDGLTAPARANLVQAGDVTSALELVIHEGRNRQVRRMCDAVGHPVRRLVRTNIGPLRDPQLPPGLYRPLTLAEVRSLYAASGNSPGGSGPPQ